MKANLYEWCRMCMCEITCISDHTFNLGAVLLKRLSIYENLLYIKIKNKDYFPVDIFELYIENWVNSNSVYH